MYFHCLVDVTELNKFILFFQILFKIQAINVKYV